MSYQHILVPLDGSTLAEKALDYLPLVAEPGTHTHLLYVDTDSYSIDLPPMMVSLMNLDLAVTRFVPPHATDESQAPLRDDLLAVGERLIQSGYHVTLEIVNGDIIESILTIADRPYDAILMATHGRTGLSKLLMGSITAGVLHEATCPVVVVPVHPEHVQRFPQKEAKTLRLLIPLDGTPEAETILPVVEKLLGDKRAKIVLVHAAVNDSLSVNPTAIESDAIYSNEAPYLYYLDHIADYLARPNREIITRVGYRNCSDEILFFANLYHVDLIAMATHGRSGLGRVLFGSVTESVLQHTPCPMLISRMYQNSQLVSATIPTSLISQ